MFFLTVVRLIWPSFASVLALLGLINLVGIPAGIAQAQIAFEEVAATAGPFRTGASSGNYNNGDGRPDCMSATTAIATPSIVIMGKDVLGRHSTSGHLRCLAK